jgi:hypothetical protein
MFEPARRIRHEDGDVDSSGFAVALSGDMALVGAALRAVGESYEQGAVYVYHLPSCPALRRPG